MRTALLQLWDSDVFYSFRHSPVTVVAAFAALVCVSGALFAPWVAPHNPFDLASVSLLDALSPPAWEAGGNPAFPLGTDDQGRDILSTILYGARISLGVGVASVVLALLLGVSLGLVSGYAGGRADAFIHAPCDVQLSFPAILIALLIDGLARVALPVQLHADIAVYVLVLAIGISGWVQYARTVRGSTLWRRTRSMSRPRASSAAVHRHHVAACAAQCNRAGAGDRDDSSGYRHHHRSHAVFPRRGVPPTTPSLGTLIGVGNKYLFSANGGSPCSLGSPWSYWFCPSTCWAIGCATC